MGGLAALLLLGCQQDDIYSYRVPKPEATRLLAAIIPHGGQTWFIKLVGPMSHVEEQKEPFDQFIRSVRFTDQAERPITWTVPQGWRTGPEAKMRYATFYLGSQEDPLELTVSMAAGSVLQNVNRWRGQIGLREIQESELGQFAKELPLDCGPATLADMTSRGGRDTGTMPAGPDIISRRAGEQPRLRYDKPEGWKEKPDRTRIRMVVFDIADGAVEGGITALPPSARELLPNVNRWRGQLRLEPVSPEQLGKDVRQIEVAGTTAHYVDLSGTGADGRTPQRMLGVMLPRDDQTWFFTIKGPVELV